MPAPRRLIRSAVALAALAFALTGVAPAAAASFAPVPEATYTGRIEDGTISITVSTDGTLVTAYAFNAVNGTNSVSGCIVGGGGQTPAWTGAPISSDAFSYSNPPSFDLTGTFTGAQSLTGTLDVDVAGQYGCNTGVQNFTATTAAAPATGPGSACNPADGKINARGSTLQTWMQEDLIGAYASDVCGYVTAATQGVNPGNLQTATGQLYFQDPNAGTGPATSFVLTDPTDPFTTSAATAADAAPYIGSNGATEPYDKSDYMISYNPYEAGNYGVTGSSQARTAISCRTDAFSGTDIPYVVADWTAINGSVGAEATRLGQACQASEPPAGANVDSTLIGSGQAWLPPFEPEPTSAAGTGFGIGNATDPTGATNPVSYGGSPQGGGLLSFPVGISAVAFPINLQTGTNGSGRAEYCGTTSTTKPAVDLSVADVAGLLAGVISNYEQLDGGDGGYTLNGTAYNDTGENPALATCNVAVTRITRYDGSGSTQAVLNFLNDALTSTGPNTGGGALATKVATCNTSLPETASIGALEESVVTTQVTASAGTNALWPGEGDAGGNVTEPVWTAATPACTADIPGGATVAGGTGISGDPALMKTLEATVGGIGYADVADLEHDANTSTLIIPKVENSSSPSLADGFPGYAAATTYASAEGNSASAKGSDCNLTNWTNPNGAGDMGLNGEWALDYGSPGSFNPSNYSDIAWVHEGNSYPACALTWDFAWGNQGPTRVIASTDPEPELDPDQRRTLYSYFTYVFSDAAQSTLPGAGYQQLPESLIDQFRTEFQAAF